MIRFLVDGYNKPIPAILEIPSKDHPYDPAQDSILSRVKYLFATESVASGRR
nr:V-type proton ATPase subunit F-like [Ipomoea trifida]